MSDTASDERRAKIERIVVEALAQEYRWASEVALAPPSVTEPDADVVTDAILAALVGETGEESEEDMAFAESNAVLNEIIALQSAFEALALENSELRARLNTESKASVEESEGSAGPNPHGGEQSPASTDAAHPKGDSK